MVNIKIDGQEVSVAEGISVLDACKSLQINIPTLCYHPDLEPGAGCGICIVKINGRILRSCCTKVAEGMDIITKDPEIIETRKTTLELLLSRHPNECLTCLKNENCELQSLATKFSLKDSFPQKVSFALDKNSNAFVCQLSSFRLITPAALFIN